MNATSPIKLVVDKHNEMCKIAGDTTHVLQARRKGVHHWVTYEIKRVACKVTLKESEIM